MSSSISDSSYILEDPPSPDDNEVDSLPSSDTTSSTEEERDLSDADREWRESLQQLELLLTMVLIPTIGKYYGRKLAFWSWTKFMMWKYPVEVVITNPWAFKSTGMVEAAATL